MRRLFKADHPCCTCPSMLSMTSATRPGLTLPSVYLQTFPDPLTRNRLLRPRHSIPAGSEQRVAAVWAARVTGVVDHSGVSSRARVSPMQQTPASERKPNVFIDDIESRTRWKAAIRFGSNARDTILSRRASMCSLRALLTARRQCAAPLTSLSKCCPRNGLGCATPRQRSPRVRITLANLPNGTLLQRYHRLVARRDSAALTRPSVPAALVYHEDRRVRRSPSASGPTP